MEVLHPKKIASPAFKGLNLVPGEKAGTFLLKKTKYEIIDTLSYLTAVTSATGFAVGGYGLLSDQLHDLKTGEYKKHKNKELLTTDNTNISDKFKDFGPSSKQIIHAGKNGAKEGAKTIVPSTKTAKIGLIFAKIGIAFSGIAGIFNGLSMGLPLMAAGETLNLGASPIVETPLGTGLFGVALAAVFSGRALEHDPLLKLDLVKLSQQKGLGKKALYVLQNVKNCAKEVGNTAVTFGEKIGHLFTGAGAKRDDAISFFKNNVFSIKPKNIAIQEFINYEKQVKNIKITFKNNPYLMHAASLILAIGGATLALSSVLKSKTGQKIGLKTYEVGGGLDNLSLSRSGLEKAAKAGSGPGAGKLAGTLLGLSGVTILAGQPGVDEKWGRGIQWAGTALLFAVFAVERRPNAFLETVERGELTSLIRQHNIDLTKLFTKAELAEKMPSGKSRLDSIIHYAKDKVEIDPDKKIGPFKKLINKIFKPKPPVQEEERVMEDSTLKAIIDFGENVLKNKSYQNGNPETEEVFDFMKEFEKYIKENNIKINLEKVKNAFSKEPREGVCDEIASSLEKETKEKFQAA